MLQGISLSRSPSLTIGLTLTHFTKFFLIFRGLVDGRVGLIWPWARVRVRVRVSVRVRGMGRFGLIWPWGKDEHELDWAGKVRNWGN